MTTFQKFNSRLFNSIGNFFDTNPVVIFIAQTFGFALGALFIVVLAQDPILLLLLPFTKNEGHALMLAWIIITIACLYFLRKKPLKDEK